MKGFLIAFALMLGSATGFAQEPAEEEGTNAAQTGTANENRAARRENRQERREDRRERRHERREDRRERRHERRENRRN